MSEAVLFLFIGAFAVILGAFLIRNIGAFSGQKPQDYADGFPVFDLREHLTGQMICEGVIFGPLGRVTSTFIADFDIVWDGETGVMTEVFTYDDKSVQHREWTIRLGKAGAFKMTAPDVVGKGVGMLSGPTVQMCYAIRLPEESGGHVLKALDWMYLTRDGTIVNRSQFRKYGIRVAELVATIRKKETT